MRSTAADQREADRRKPDVCAHHQNRAGSVADTDEDVERSRRAVHKVPRLNPPFLLLNQEQALAREDEEVLLHVFAVVEAVRFAGVEDVNVDPVLLELTALRLKF